MKRGRKSTDTKPKAKLVTFGNVPTAPAYLDDVARAEYEHLVSILVEAGTIEQCDPKLVELYAINYALLQRAATELQRQPLNMVAGNGRSFINPLVGAIHNTTAKLQSIIGDLGLSPVSIGKLNLEPKPQADPLVEFARQWSTGAAK